MRGEARTELDRSTVDGPAPVRLLVLWCPDWPVVAAAAAGGVPVHLPAAVFSGNRVVACSAVARANGVRRGMRRREAQSTCPDVVVFGVDVDRDARLFEPVAAAVEELVVGVELVRPGTIAVPITGAASYFGGEERLVEMLADHVSATAGVECQIGVADGLFAATLAAHRSVLIDQGEAARFLTPLSVDELDQPDTDRGELVDLLRRLGLRTLGAFAELAEKEVTSRFGTIGLLGHRLARGRSERPPHRRTPPPELSVRTTFDPALDRIDAAAFVARTLADSLHGKLADRGLACTRLGIHATTENGEELGRVWRCAEPLTPQGIADRVRWQFEGWLHTGDGVRPTAGVTMLRLDPEETVAGRSLQMGLWQGNGSGDVLGEEQVIAAERAGRALTRVQGLLGADSVFTPVLGGGRGPAERARLVRWGDRREPDPGDASPWPGRLPAPAPATVFARRIPLRVNDSAGTPVSITDRYVLTGTPENAVLAGGEPRLIRNWAGPWPIGERWWVAEEEAEPGPRARMQILLAGAEPEVPDVALLLLLSAGENPLWTVEGMYD